MNGEMAVSTKVQKSLFKGNGLFPSSVTMSLNMSSCLHLLYHNSQKTGPGREFVVNKGEQNKDPVLALLAL